MAAKTLDEKLTRITAGHYQPKDFIIADAKDGDMAFGTQAPGPDQTGKMRSRTQYLASMQAMTRSEIVDIMLMSASSAEVLHRKGVFDGSSVTPAVRMNDTTDIWSARGSRYRDHESMPFATADIEAVKSLCDLGLYSMTFSNQVSADLNSLRAYRAFRLEMREHGFRHFLEIFNPAIGIGVPQQEMGFYINDMIIKALAGVTSMDAPLFLKLQYNGHDAMADLCSYDPTQLVVGVLGGAKGTTRDTFELVHQAEQAGARVALFGRKINLSESPVELVRLMRQTIEQSLTPEQAVKAYHEHLQSEGIKPWRALPEDLQITDKGLAQ